jgi:phosphatidate cytidylyltransferase
MSGVRERKKSRSDSLLEEVSEKEAAAHESRSTSDVDPAAKEVPAVLKKGFWKSFGVRAQFASLMMLTFMAIVWAGHFYVWLLIVLLQMMSFRELVKVRYSEYRSGEKTEKMPLFRTLQWGWFYVALVYVYGDFIHSFAMTHDSAAVLLPYSRYWELASFGLYCGVFMVSIWTLKVDSVKYQVGQLSWTIVTLCIVVGQMKFVAHNIFEGLFWFFFPAWLVINNDCWAYAWGACLGRKIIKKPFFKLSPKKTWEGFLGALCSTIAVGYYTAPLFATSAWLTCPATELTLEAHRSLRCETPDVFRVRATVVVPYVNVTLRDVLPMQLHAVAFALFASVVAPFGGFLASAVKRAYHVKDFDSLIPGHGGVTDRVDCEFIMALFVYVYHKTLIRAYDVDWRHLAASAALLSDSDKARLAAALV